jgi:hypothetical protein
MSDFDHIEIRKSQSMDQQTWILKMRVIDLLCSMGKVIEWINDKHGPYKHVPKVYLIQNVRVEFHPEWNHYLVGGVRCNSLPETEEDFNDMLSSLSNT